MTDKEPQGSPFYLDTDGVWKLREPQGEGLLLTINEWLDAIGCDRTYRKDMKETYQKTIPELKAQLAKCRERMVELPATSTEEYQKLRQDVIDRLNSWHLSGRQATGQLGEVADSVLALLGEEK